MPLRKVNASMFCGELIAHLPAASLYPPPAPRNHRNDSPCASSWPSGRPNGWLTPAFFSFSAAALSSSQVLGGSAMPAFVNSSLL
jgi:hypothetical protein